MAHFAEIDIANRVTRVIVVHDSLEASGAEWCAEQYGGRWVQTSYNANGNPAKRYNFAGIGFTYDPARDAFIPPNPGFPSWTLDEANCLWVAPVPYPHGGGTYQWDESTETWIESKA